MKTGVFYSREVETLAWQLPQAVNASARDGAVIRRHPVIPAIQYPKSSITCAPSTEHFILPLSPIHYF